MVFSALSAPMDGAVRQATREPVTTMPALSCLPFMFASAQAERTDLGFDRAE